MIYTVKDFEKVKPDDVAFSQMLFKGGNISSVLGYDLVRNQRGNLSLIWDRDGHAWSRNITAKDGPDYMPLNGKNVLNIYRHEGFLFFRDNRFDLKF